MCVLSQAHGGHLQDQTIVARKSLALDDRLSYDFFHYMKSVLLRLGLTEGCVVATRHNGKIGSVHFHGSVGRFGIPWKVRLSEAAKRVLLARLDRLTRDCDIRFGCIIIDVAAGDINNANFTVSVRPREHAASATLARLGICRKIWVNRRRSCS